MEFKTHAENTLIQYCQGKVQLHPDECKRLIGEVIAELQQGREVNNQIFQITKEYLMEASAKEYAAPVFNIDNIPHLKKQAE